MSYTLCQDMPDNGIYYDYQFVIGPYDFEDEYRCLIETLIYAIPHNQCWDEETKTFNLYGFDEVEFLDTCRFLACACVDFKVITTIKEKENKNVRSN